MGVLALSLNTGGTRVGMQNVWTMYVYDIACRRCGIHGLGTMLRRKMRGVMQGIVYWCAFFIIERGGNSGGGAKCVAALRLVAHW